MVTHAMGIAYVIGYGKRLEFRYLIALFSRISSVTRLSIRAFVGQLSDIVGPRATARNATHPKISQRNKAYTPSFFDTTYINRICRYLWKFVNICKFINLKTIYRRILAFFAFNDSLHSSRRAK